jgi:carbon monoxide dehydrogenase subunit G
VPRYHTSVATPRRPEEAFDFMAAFENIATWDPGVVEAERIGSGDVGVGSRFRVVVSSAGRKLPLEYRITEFERPHRVRLVAETSTLRSIDEITVEATPATTTVGYDARLELVGALGIFNPAVAVVLRRIGDRAAAGLRRVLQT